MPLRHVVLCSVALVLVLLAGCDAAPGAEELSSTAPRLTELTYSPEYVALAGLPEADVTEDSVRFSVQFDVRASDSDGDVAEVHYAVRAPDPLAPVVSVGVVESSVGGRFGGTAEVRIPRGQIGNYTLSLYALDDSGRLSNTLRGLITFTAEGRPPVVEEVLADPDTILVARDSILTLTAVVDDPDGISNLARVVVRTPNGQELEMLDDGIRYGDDVAGDGRYNARFENVHLATPNTTQTFAVQAFDRTGLASNIVEKAIRIE